MAAAPALVTTSHNVIDGKCVPSGSGEVFENRRRAALLFRTAQIIADRKETLALDMTREMGKVRDETGTLRRAQIDTADL